MRAILIANASDTDAGFIGERFRSHGYAFTECHREHPDEWPTLDGFELVLMLGSDWSVYWDRVAREVAAEVAMIRSAHNRGVPVYGICFGNQTLSLALGGEVERAPEPEVGWYQVESSAVPVIEASPWMQWHYDRVVPADGVEVLARSDRAVQAITLGRSFATQFHPEVDVSILDRWARTGGAPELDRLGIDRDELFALTAANVAVSQPAAAALVDWYLETIASR